MLLENHGALAVGADLITAFYRMESLELWAKITINAVILGGSHDISRENIPIEKNGHLYWDIDTLNLYLLETGCTSWRCRCN